MTEYILPLQKLIEEFCRLSGVGQKTATRYAFAVLDMTEEERIDIHGEEKKFKAKK